MSSSLRRGALAAVVLAAIVPLSACAAGTSSDTLQVKPNTAATSIGNDLKLNGIAVVTKADAQPGTPGPVNVTVNISNTGTSDETLQSVTVGDGAAATFTDAKGAALPAVIIPAGGHVLLGGDGQPVAHVASANITIGGYAKVAFSFKQAGGVAVAAQVVPAKGYYAAFGPAAATAAPATPAVPGAPTASASATAPATTPTTPATGAATAPATTAATASAAASAPATAGAPGAPTAPGASASAH